MEISILSKDNELLMIKKEWNDLLTSSNSDNVFLTWEWMYTWWEHFKKNKTLVIILIKENKELIGIAPFYLVKTIFFGLKPLAHLEFLGSVQTCPEYLDFIIKKGREKEVLRAILEKIFFAESIKWDVLNMVSIKSNSENLKICKDFFTSNKIQNYVYERRNLPYIEFSDSLNEYLKTLSTDKQNRFLRYKRNLTKTHSISLEAIENCGDLDNIYDTFLNMYRKRWESKGQEGSFYLGRDDYINFHRSIIKAFFNNNWLYFAALKIDNKFVAFQYDFVYGNKLYYHSVAFDPEWSKYRVGSVLLLMVIENSISRKFTELDFLRGEEEYKFHWTKTTRETIDIVIWKSRFTNYRAEIEKGLRKLLKIFIPKALAQKIYKNIFTRK